MIIVNRCRLEPCPGGLNRLGLAIWLACDSLDGLVMEERNAMPSALSVDLRERVVAAIEAGASRRQAAKRFGVGTASAVRWHERFRQDGQIAPRPVGGDRNSQRLEAQAALILRLNEEHPLSFLRELRDRLSERGVRASTSSLSCFFAWHGITRKKGLSTRPSRSGRM